MVPLKRWDNVGKILGKSTKMSQEEATPMGTHNGGAQALEPADLATSPHGSTLAVSLGS